MYRIYLLIVMLLMTAVSTGQKIESVYLNQKDSSSNMFIAVVPKNNQVKSFMVLLDGFGNAPKDVLNQTDIPKYASQQSILTIIPLLKTGPSYFGSDSASQESLKELINIVVARYQLKDKDMYIGGFSIGGTCAVKYAGLAVQHNFPIKAKAVFAIDPPLDWERYYNAAKRVVRLSDSSRVNGEVFYMINRIEKEMGGPPSTALQNYYRHSAYSFSDTTQKAVKNLIHTPIMLISEPDIQWWLKERHYDYSYNNIMDHAAMINELQRLGNKNAVLVTTKDKGFRKPNNTRHPHSWSIADPEQLVNWLRSLP